MGHGGHGGHGHPRAPKSQAAVDRVSDVGGGGTVRNRLAGALLFHVGSLVLIASIILVILIGWIYFSITFYNIG